MTLVRSIVAIAIGYTILAIGIGATGVPVPGTESTAPSPSGPSLVDALASRNEHREEHYLIDRSSGRKSPLRLPEADRWAIVSLNPWRGAGGELEAVGRWVNPGEVEFCGWGVFRLSDGAVLDRIETAILPVGRPCWAPWLRSTMIYPAADGRLYRCRLAAGVDGGGAPAAAEGGLAGQKNAVAIGWAIAPPGSGQVVLADPAWSSDPRLRKWIIVSLSQQGRRGGRIVFGPPRLWWLELNDEADTIAAAGRLLGTVGDDDPLAGPGERYASLEAGPRGEMRLAYLTGSSREKTWRLRSAELRFEAGTGRPVRAASDRDVAVPGDGVDASPLVFSSDGRTVYAMSGSGRLDAIPLPESADRD